MTRRTQARSQSRPVSRRWEGTPAWQIARNLAVLERVQRVADHASDLGVADARLLWLLGDGAPRTLREIADELGLEQSTVNRQVNAALAEGLLVRFREPGRSSYLLTSTDEGSTRLTEALRRRLGLFDAALAALPSAERADVVRTLTAFVDAYAQAVDTSGQ